MSKSRLSVGATLLLLCASATAVYAQARTVQLPPIDIERLQFNPGAEESLVVPTGRLSEAGKVRFTLLFDYVNQPSVTRLRKGQGGARLLNRAEGVAMVSLTPNEWVQLELQFPVILYQDEMQNLSSKGFAPVGVTGFGTPLMKSLSRVNAPILPAAWS